MEKYTLKNIIFIILGTSILAFGTGIFIVPFDLVTGGVSSVAIIINSFLSFEGSIDIYISIITWLLYGIGVIILGKSFAIKTLISTIVYPIIFSLSYRLVDSNVLNGFFNLANNSNYKEISILLASIFGGAFVGAGCAITFLGGGTTGGLDVLAFVICKYFKKVKSSVIIFVIDVILILLGAFVIKDLVVSLLGITSAFICAIVIDKIFLGETKAFIAQIITPKYEEINNEVISRLDRTTTIIDCLGGYSKENKKIVMVSFSVREYRDLISIVSIYDKDAFITIHRAHEINGLGWNEL